jgi:hypothetical protein
VAANFLTALVETTYADQGNTDERTKVKGLDNSSDYFDRVTTVNADDVSASVVVQVAALIDRMRSPAGDFAGSAVSLGKRSHMRPLRGSRNTFGCSLRSVARS